MLLPLLHACYTRTTCSALLLQCPDDCILAQPLPLPTAISSTDIGCGTLALAPRSHTATPTARDSNLGSGNHDMYRLSAFAYPNDAPIHGLTDIRLAYRYSQRILVRHPRPSHPDQTHTTAQLWLHKHPHCQQTTCMHLLSRLVGLRASTWPPLPFVHPEHSPGADI
jgi:hypothetical protein